MVIVNNNSIKQLWTKYLTMNNLHKNNKKR